MRKMLQIITLAELGGAGRVVTTLINNLPHEEFDITLVTGEGEELISWLNADAKEKVRHVQLKSLIRAINPVRDLLVLWQLYRLIKREKFEIVHCHSSKAGIIGRLAAWLAGAPKVYFTVHGWVMDAKQPWWLRTIYVVAEKVAAWCSTKVICVSEADRKIAFKYNITPKNKLHVIHNGVAEIPKPPSILKKFDKDKFIVTMIARLAAPKLPLLFLETAVKLKIYERILFVLIGGGKQQEECKAFVEGHNLKNVVLMGEIPYAREHFYDADVAVLLSEHEGLPMVIIEAMFAGKPVIASNVGGVKELIVHSETGFAIKNKVAEVAEKVTQLYENRNMLQKMSEASLRHAQEHFSARKMTDEYLKVYNS